MLQRFNRVAFKDGFLTFDHFWYIYIRVYFIVSDIVHEVQNTRVFNLVSRHQRLCTDCETKLKAILFLLPESMTALQYTFGDGRSGRDGARKTVLCSR